jgi:hypothetical protein
MNGALLQSKIAYGLQRAASAIGSMHTQYRPGEVINNPISPVYALGQIPCAFTLNGGMKPGSWVAQTQQNQLFWQIIAPVAQLQVGDYLVGQNTYCVVGLDALMIPLALRCTQTLTFSRQPKNTAAGLQSYSALAAPAPVVYAQGIPGAMNIKKETGRPQADLPGDASLRAFYVCNFYLPDGLVQHRDIVTDENGLRYQVVSVSSGLLGTQALVEVLES